MVLSWCGLNRITSGLFESLRHQSDTRLPDPPNLPVRRLVGMSPAV